MKEPNRVRKGEIGFLVSLNDEQQEAKRLIRENQIVLITGRAGSGKSLVAAQTALDFLLKKECSEIFVTRAAIEVGTSLGFLPGNISDKFNPYLEAFMENLEKCYDRLRIAELVKEEKIKAFPVQFIRGRTMDEVLVIEEVQNLSKGEVLAILTRLGKSGKLIFNGDATQCDTGQSFTGLDYLIELSKGVPDIKWIKLKENHRSDLVGKILDWEHANKK